MNLIRTLQGVVAFEEESHFIIAGSVVVHLIMMDLLLQLVLFMMKTT